MKTKNKFRLNLDFPVQVKEKLEKMKSSTESTSNVEVIRRALALFELVLDNGNTVHLKDKDGNYTEIRIL